MRSTIIAVLICAISATIQPAPEPLHAAGIIPMPAVEGRIDHLAVDVAGKRLFVAALGNNTVEVIDIGAMRGTKSITGLHEPQGIRFLPDRNRVVVRQWRRRFNRLLRRHIALGRAYGEDGGDADNVRYDPTASRVPQ